MAAAAIPALIKVGSMVGGALLSKKLSKPSPTMATATGQTQTGVQQLAAQAGNASHAGASLVGSGSGYLGAAGNYYTRLLSGNKGELTAATAPEMSKLMDYYRGASGKATRTLRGGSRDFATAELDRQRVGQMALIPTAARATAAEGASRVGGNLLSSGGNLMGTGIYGSASGVQGANTLYNQGTDASDRARKSGSAYGGLLYDMLQQMPWKSGGGGSSSGSGMTSFFNPPGMAEGDGF